MILVLLIGTLGLQVALSSGSEEIRIGVVGDVAQLEPALEAQGQALEVDVEVVELDDEAAGRAAVEAEEVDGVLVAGGGPGAAGRSSRRAGRCRPSSRVRWRSWRSPSSCRRPG